MSENKNIIDGKYIFRSGNESFFTLSILHHTIWSLVIFACLYKYINTYYHQHIIVLLIITIVLFAILATCPSGSKRLYYRWLIFKYNRSTVFSIDTERKSFTYKHGEKVITFVSKDIEKWSWGSYRFANTTFVKIVRFKLKDGEKIEISSGIGNVNGFLQENWERLGLPKGTYRYGDNFKSLQSYIKRIEET